MLKELNVNLMVEMHFVGFFCVNNNKEVDCNNPQIMQYTFLLQQSYQSI
jgi:hypothetical protein